MGNVCKCWKRGTVKPIQNEPKIQDNKIQAKETPHTTQNNKGDSSKRTKRIIVHPQIVNENPERYSKNLQHQNLSLPIKPIEAKKGNSNDKEKTPIGNILNKPPQTNWGKIAAEFLKNRFPNNNDQNIVNQDNEDFPVCIQNNGSRNSFKLQRRLQLGSSDRNNIINRNESYKQDIVHDISNDNTNQKYQTDNFKSDRDDNPNDIMLKYHNAGQYIGTPKHKKKRPVSPKKTYEEALRDYVRGASNFTSMNNSLIISPFNDNNIEGHKGSDKKHLKAIEDGSEIGFSLTLSKSQGNQC